MPLFSVPSFNPYAPPVHPYGTFNPPPPHFQPQHHQAHLTGINIPPFQLSPTAPGFTYHHPSSGPAAIGSTSPHFIMGQQQHAGLHLPPHPHEQFPYGSIESGGGSGLGHSGVTDTNGTHGGGGWANQQLRAGKRW